MIIPRRKQWSWRWAGNRNHCDTLKATTYHIRSSFMIGNRASWSWVLSNNEVLLLWKVKCIVAYLRKQRTCRSCWKSYTTSVAAGCPACTKAVETCQREGSRRRRGCIVSIQRSRATCNPAHVWNHTAALGIVVSARATSRWRRSSSPLHLLGDNDWGRRQKKPDRWNAASLSIRNQISDEMRNRLRIGMLGRRENAPALPARQ